MVGRVSTYIPQRFFALSGVATGKYRESSRLVHFVDSSKSLVPVYDELARTLKKDKSIVM